MTCNGPLESHTRLLRVLDDEVVDTFHERVLETLRDRKLAPLEIFFSLYARLALELRRYLHEAFGRVRAPGLEQRPPRLRAGRARFPPRKYRAARAFTMPMSMPPAMAW